MKIINYSILLVSLLTLFFSCSKGQEQELIFEYGTVSDIDANTYKTVKIGGRWWMCENLKVSRFNDGAPINYLSSNDTIGWQSTPAYKIVNDSLYGKLYNYLALTDPRGIAQLQASCFAIAAAIPPPRRPPRVVLAGEQ